MVNKGNESYLQNDFKITIKSKVYFYNPLEDELLLFNSRNGNVILTCWVSPRNVGTLKIKF